ncbi:Rv3654c family TadE-like protein [Microbacterium gorillae]|uniref:Rv3654c family TadE-like protein n=1 Tax=Microbacterium gorillae TaxID=1231063 RepID=UPI000693D4EF|nr:Rv3654c family TadE-like protein [Microbacterium gorillae]
MSTTVTGIGTLMGVTVLLVGGIAVGQAAAASQRVAGAADAAALAAADTLAGATTGDPCDRADELARRNGAALDRCDLNGLIATVSVSARVLGLPVRGAARAGTRAPADDGSAGADYPNGAIPREVLRSIPWRADLLLRGDAAAALVAMNTAYRAEHGADLPLSDAYRDLAGQKEQRRAWCARGACEFAAVPGTSNHGWGTAIDVGIARTDFGSATYRWLVANARRFGWTHPTWAEPGGTAPEAWHWEFTG